MDSNWQGIFENNLRCDEFQFDIWIDAPAVPNEESGWIINEENSCITNEESRWIMNEEISWISNEECSCISNEDSSWISYEDNSWITATTFEAFFEQEFDEQPRTSTPEPSSSAEELDDSTNEYAAWKNHLHTSPNKDKVKVRGISFEYEDIISGHLDMQKQDDDCEMYPLLNKCFLNLIINGPPPLIFPEEKRRQNLLKDEFDLYPCNCAANLAKNVNLPIGYKYNDNGIAVPAAASAQDKMYYRDPTCIYTA